MSSINLGNLPIEEVREIASKGGDASHRRHDTDTVKDTTHSSTHTSTTTSTNPGNFANRPKEEVRETASKGGKASSGGFASMDPNKQVRASNPTLLNIMRVLLQKKD